MDKKVLHLPIKWRWLKQIINGNKIWEYRKMSHYYNVRLYNKDQSFRNYDEIWLRAGYRKDSPLVKIEWFGWTIATWEGERCYAFDVHRIISKHNLPKSQHKRTRGKE